MSAAITPKLYEVALSFAGEDRPYVRQVADFLRTNGVRVFYDEFEQATLWGTDLHETLDRIYRTESDFVLMFISVAYASKIWTKHERRSALAAALSAKQEYVLPARFDDTQLEGLSPTIAYLDLRSIDPGQLGSILLRKLDPSGRRSGIHLPSPAVPGVVTFRITRDRYVKDLSGQGARVAGGRWNQPGVPVIYAANSLCNALLELLAVSGRLVARNDYIAVSLRIPSAVPIKTIYSESLPTDWNTDIGIESQTRRIGTEWAKSMETCVLSVPSVLIPEDRTYVFNPSHSDFSRILIGERRPVSIDPRLTREFS